MTQLLGAVIGVQVEGWQAAIEAACQPLLDGGSVDARYVERCVEMVSTHGPYIVVAPGIALAHARPEDGAIKLGLAVATLSEPVDFGHEQNDPVNLVFAFATPDREQHIHLLAAIAEGISRGLAEKLRRAGDPATARTVLEEILDEV